MPLRLLLGGAGSGLGRSRHIAQTRDVQVTVLEPARVVTLVLLAGLSHLDADRLAVVAVTVAMELAFGVVELLLVDSQLDRLAQLSRTNLAHN